MLNRKAFKHSPKFKADYPIQTFPYAERMTTYIPSLTLPGEIFTRPAVSILLPVALGTSIGFIVRRTLHAIIGVQDLLIPL